MADAGDSPHYMEPVSYSGDASQVLEAIEAVITESGGTVTSTIDDGVDALFTTSLMRFKDDVSFRLDEEAKLLHFRSASRVGHSDLGANRKRMEELVPRIIARLA